MVDNKLKDITIKKFPNSNSAVDQEAFVLNVLQEKRNGYYVEIGAFHSRIGSNTFLLETEYDWKGVGLDIKEKAVIDYNSNRKNPCVLADAISFNFDEYFKQNNFPQQIDFLQVDVDHYPENSALLTLLNIPFSRYRFSVICFEHDDMDWENEHIKTISRNLLTMLGYKLVVREQNEDFWVDPTFIDKNVWGHFMASNHRNGPYHAMLRE
jgi:hypothetical protein